MLFEVLGPIRIRAGAGEVPVRGRRERILLAMLLLEAGRPVPADRLIDAIWGEQPPATARNQVHVAVFRLRNRLADAGAATPVLRTDADGYRVVVPPGRLDLIEYRDEVAAARRAAAGDATRAREHYRAALARWRGPAFADVDSRPVRQASVPLDDERLQVWEECLHLELRLGGGGELVGEIAGLVAMHPFRERLHAALMCALYRAGRQADALAAYRRVRALLHGELGTEPGAELRQLHRAILNGEDVFGGGAPSAPVTVATRAAPAAGGAPPGGAPPVVRLLGPVELRGDGGRIPLGGPRQGCLLAMLAMTAGQPVPVDVLADQMWSENGPRKVREALYTQMSRLRGAVQRAGGGLARRDGGYVLEIDPDRVDLLRARWLTAEAGRAAGTGEGDARAGRLLREASELWRGTPLAGLPGEWAARTRTGLEQERLATLMQRFEIELRRGEHATVIGPLSAARAEYPSAEPLAAQLMLAYHRCGRPDDALDVYTRLRRQLGAERGAEPTRSLQHLYRRILRRDPELMPPGGAESAAAVSGGADPDGADPDGAEPDLSEVPVGARVPPPVPAQLPPDVGAFTGRGRGLAQLDALLPGEAAGATATMIAAIEGAPGIGKTALAVHWAHLVRHRFPDGQLYADLRGYAPLPPLPPVDVLARFLTALGVPRDQVPIDAEEAVAAYRSLLADRRVLVVLDNAANPDQVRPLLPSGHGSLVLVTSRDQLTGLVAREGAHRVCLAVLPEAESIALLELVLGAERTGDEPRATAELARLCGHLPLALRIAAANLGGHPQHRIAGYVRQLRDADRLGALAVSGDPDNAVPAAFDLSYTRLPDPVRRTFRLLGLLPSKDFPIHAVAALAGSASPAVGRWLDQLTAAHLLEERAPGRYGCHDLVRRYAADRAQIEETERSRAAALARLHAYYLTAADAAVRTVMPVSVRLPVPAGPEPPRFDDSAEALAWLDTERANLVAVASQAHAHGLPSTAWRLADVLRGYLALTPYLGAWATVVRAGLAAAAAAGDAHALAAAHLNCAHLHLRGNRYPAVIEHATTALVEARSAGWVEGEYALLNLLGNAYWATGELALALEHYSRACGGLEQLGWKPALAALRGNLARVSVEMGRLDDAAEYARQSLAEPPPHGVAVAEAIALNVLGEVHHLRGQLSEAVELFTRTREVATATGFHSGEADALHALALVARDRGDRVRAGELAETALALTREHSLRRVEAECLGLLAELRGDDVVGYQEALAVARAAGDRYPEADALIGLAGAQQRRGDAAAAGARAAEALTIARTVGYRLLEVRALTVLAEALLAGGAHDRAVTHAEAALRISTQTGHRLAQARARLVLGHAARAGGRPDAARDHWRAALAGFREVGVPEADIAASLLAT